MNQERESMQPTQARATPSRRQPRHAQRGAVLFVVLMVLSLLLLAGLGVMRSVDTSNVIAGNYSFQQAAVQASDRAVTDALNGLASIVVAGGGNANVANRYYQLRQTTLDSRGFPTAVNWSNVACANEIGQSISNCDASVGNYRVQYVIERLCSSQPTLSDVTSLRANCEYEAAATATTAAAVALRYRILIRVRGPRSTEGWFEAVVSGPASA
jgi:type IV pilus assembly protein PilX